MFDTDDRELVLITAKSDGGGLPVSADPDVVDALSKRAPGVEGIAGVLAAVGLGNRLVWREESTGAIGERDGHLATDPERRAALARGYALQVFEDSAVVLGERHITDAALAEWFGVRRPELGRTIQVAEATRFCAGGRARCVLILDPLLPSRIVFRYGGLDRELERLAIESEASAEGPVADAFITPPVEVGIYGRHIATSWVTPAGAFPVWTSTEGARWLARVPRAIRELVGDPDPVDLARAALRSLGVITPPELIPIPSDASGVDLSSHLGPSEEASHRWAVRSKETV